MVKQALWLAAIACLGWGCGHRAPVMTTGDGGAVLPTGGCDEPSIDLNTFCTGEQAKIHICGAAVDPVYVLANKYYDSHYASSARGFNVRQGLERNTAAREYRELEVTLEDGSGAAMIPARMDPARLPRDWSLAIAKWRCKENACTPYSGSMSAYVAVYDGWVDFGKASTFEETTRLGICIRGQEDALVFPEAGSVNIVFYAPIKELD